MTKVLINKPVAIPSGYENMIAQITNHVFLGNNWIAHRYDVLRNMGIRKVISVMQQYDMPSTKKLQHSGISHYKICIPDNEKTLISRFFYPSFCEIRQHLLQYKSKVLVHCHAGVSRSATIVIAYLMRAYGLSLSKAYTYVLSRRHCIQPNAGFCSQLEMFEMELFYSASRKRKKQLRLELEKIGQLPAYYHIRQTILQYLY